MATTRKSAGAANSGEDSGTFTDQEKAAMKERAAELKATKRGGSKKAAADATALADKLAEMPDHERVIGQGIHDIVTEVAPDLLPRTWYGMPAYADADGKAVCFFKAASKFGSRYAELGFNEQASLDDGTMWPTAYAITTLSKADEKLIATLVRKAVG